MIMDLEVTRFFFRFVFPFKTDSRYRALPGGPLWTPLAPWLAHLLAWAPLPIDGWKFAPPPPGTPGRGPPIIPPLPPPLAPLPLPEFGGGPPLSEDPGLKFLFPPWNGILSWLGFCNSGFGSLKMMRNTWEILNNYVNFAFSIMKKLWDLAHENLVNLQGNHGILNQYSCVSAIPYK